MQIEVKIDASCREPKLTIQTAEMTEEINQLLKMLSAEHSQVILGIREQKFEVLEQKDMIRIYASGGRVYAVTQQGEYLLRLRLYELEERLDASRFVRISNSEIIQLQKAVSFDLGIAGTICVRLTNGTTTYVSRRYVSKIKRRLGI